MNPRILTLLSLAPMWGREYVGLHEHFDGAVGELSPRGVAALLERLGEGPTEPDEFDEAVLRAHEQRARVTYGRVEEHRWNPFRHIECLDVSGYDREYAAAEVRAAARARHLAAWPTGVDNALASLDRVPRLVADAALPAARGLAAGVDDGPALEAHARLVAHLEEASEHGPSDARLGPEVLAALLGSGEAVEVDLDDLAARATAERHRLRTALEERCEALRPGADPDELVRELVRDHPTTAAQIHAEAREQLAEAATFTEEHDLLPPYELDARVGNAPESRRFAMAMASPAAPYESAQVPSWYWVVPPEPDWPQERIDAWLQVFSRTTLPAITVHEAIPGHLAHLVLLRELDSTVRRCLFSESFAEGWAHYVEELFVELGFRADDPRFAIGVYLEALLRVARLEVAIGVHTGGMTMDEAAALFTSTAFLESSAAEHEAERSLHDPSYGRYTWGKLEIVALRERAREQWGEEFSLRRFHGALLALGCPPLGLVDHAVVTG